MFQKVRDPVTGEEWSGAADNTETSRKRHSDEPSHSEPPKVPRNT